MIGASYFMLDNYNNAYHYLTSAEAIIREKVLIGNSEKLLINFVGWGKSSTVSADNK